MDHERQSERKFDVWQGHPLCRLYRLHRNSGKWIPGHTLFCIHYIVDWLLIQPV
jgi:hypothetical protein